MALTPGTKTRLLNARPYILGQVTSRAIEALLRDLEDKISAGQSYPDPREVKVTDANGTAQVGATGAGTYYGVRVQNTDGDAISVIVSDAGNDILLGVCVCPGAVSTAEPGAAECYLHNPTAYGTDIRVRAFKKSDGTTAADSGNTVFVLVG